MFHHKVITMDKFAKAMRDAERREKIKYLEIRAEAQLKRSEMYQAEAERAYKLYTQLTEERLQLEDES